MSKCGHLLAKGDYMAWLACTAETDKEKIEEPKYELVKVDSKNNALLDEEGNRKYYRGEDGTSDPSSGLTLEEITESKEAKNLTVFRIITISLEPRLVICMYLRLIHLRC